MNSKTPKIPTLIVLETIYPKASKYANIPGCSSDSPNSAPKPAVEMLNSDTVLALQAALFTLIISERRILRKYRARSPDFHN